MSQQAVIYLRVSTAAQADTDVHDEGYSIPAQREHCSRKAETLSAVVVDEYIDRGESARSADRPALQRMLARLEQGDIDYVIVHKVDRLARSRVDDVSIGLAIRRAGAQLVSATENIDETPSGKLLHGIMATIAEFYSQNLATEAKKGMTQKAKVGGTPGRPPLGYLNVREVVDGREIRTIAVDPERAPHIRWMFEAYRSGEWTVTTLTEGLADRGLKTRPTKRCPAKPLVRAQVANLLANRYYIGIVSFDGVDYDGRHRPLIDLDTFEEVQAILEARAVAKERPWHNQHYLKGSLWCGRCRSRLTFIRVKGNGGTYEYFFCLGRQRRNGCTQPYVAVTRIEEAVLDHYARVSLTQAEADAIRIMVGDYLRQAWSRSEQEAARQRRRVVELETQRRKLLEAHYADALPLALFKEEQDRISRELARARVAAAGVEHQLDDIDAIAAHALTLVTDAQAIYANISDRGRRLMNQAIFEHIWIDEDMVAGADITEPVRDLMADDLAARLAGDGGQGGPVTYHRRGFRPLSKRERPFGELVWETENPGHRRDRGSNESIVVGPPGFEPGTSSLSGMRSNRAELWALETVDA